MTTAEVLLDSISQITNTHDLVVTHEEEPAMPPEGDRLDDKKLAILRTWIEFGMPDFTTKRRIFQIHTG